MSKNTSNEDVKNNEPEAYIFGNDVWKLITKYTNETKGIMKSTKAMQCSKDVVLQVTTQQRNPDGSYSVAEALTTLNNKKIIELKDSDNKVIGRNIVDYENI